MTESRTHSPIYQYMLRSHAYLHDLYHRLLAAMEADAPDVRLLWEELDHGLLSHMEAEERFILPKFAHVDKAEALSILREHGTFREQLFELGIAIDLHLLRYDRSREFITALDRHATREESLLYRWADEHLGQRIVDIIRDRVPINGAHALHAR